MENKKILVPVDFSACSKNALDYAVAIGSRMAANICLFHCYHYPFTDYSNAMYAYDIDKEGFEEQVGKSFDLLLENFSDYQALFYKKLIRVGAVVDEVQKVIKEEDIDWIVMGTQGVNSTLDRVLGSLSSEMIRQSPVPVLVVPEALRFNGIDNIMLASDYHKTGNPSVFDPLLELAETFDAKVHIFNVDQHLKEEDYVRDPDAVYEEVKIGTYFKNIDHSFEFAEAGDVEDKILEFAYREHIDILAVMPQKHTFFERLFHGSVSRKLAMSSHIPLLALFEK